MLFSKQKHNVSLEILILRSHNLCYNARTFGMWYNQCKHRCLKRRGFPNDLMRIMTNRILKQAPRFSEWSHTYNAKPTAYNAIPTAYNAIPTAYNAKPTAYNAIPTAYNAIPTAYNAIPTAYNAIPTAYNAKPTAYNAKPTAYNARTTAYIEMSQHKEAMAFHSYGLSE